MLPGNIMHIYSYVFPASLNVTVNVSTSNEAISLCFVFLFYPPLQPRLPLVLSLSVFPLPLFE